MAVLLPRVSPWRRTLRVLQFLAVLWCSLMLGLYLSYKVVERQWMIRSLPAAIEPRGVVLLADDGGFRESCGAAVFRLSGDTAQQVQAHGLQYLDQARQARRNNDRYGHFEQWQQTPLDIDVDEGLIGLSCAEPDKDLQRRIYQAAGRPGSFYAKKDDGLLLVLPSEGLIMFGYSG